MLQDFLSKLQKELDLKELIPGDEQASYSIFLDDTKIQISDMAPGFQFSAVIGTLPREKTEEFLAKMLRGNLFGQATKRAHLGLDETGEQIKLNLAWPSKATYKEFIEQFEDFINAVDFWKGELKEASVK